MLLFMQQQQDDGWNDYQYGWIPDDGQFGARLALVRQRMAWGNVKEAALACGIPVESWRSWERDGAYPRKIDEVSRRIADRTGADFMWVMSGESWPRELAEQRQMVRHQGFEPRTRWFGGSAPADAVVIPFPAHRRRDAA